MQSLVQDLRYAARSLSTRPAFTLAAVLTLAVGIGANTAMYSVVDATLLRPLPFRDPDRLMKVSLLARHPGMPDNPNQVWSYPKYETFRRIQNAFSESAIYRGTQFTLDGAEGVERIPGEQVSADYLPLLGIQALVGRVFLPEEDRTPETHRVALLSYGTWQRHFGGDPSAVGREIALGDDHFTIVGVLPAGFKGLTGTAEVWIPVMAWGADELPQAWSHSWHAVARLNPGVEPAQAAASMAVLGDQIYDAHPGGHSRWGAAAQPLNEMRLDPAMRKAVLVLFGAVGFVLLIACVNVANLLLARGSTRRREMAIRQSLGASRGRLVRQLLTESVLLAGAGAAAGLAVAYWGIELLAKVGPDTAAPFGRRLAALALIGFSSIRIDGSALLFTCGAALATGILFGLAPAITASRNSISAAIKGFPPRRTASRLPAGRDALTVVEIALAMVLLAGAGLTIRSFERLLAVESGVDPENVLTMRIAASGPPGRGWPAAYEELESRVARAPGVTSAGLGSCHALAGGCSSTVIWFRDRPPAPPGSEPAIGTHFVSPGYFRTMKIPLIAGRWFTDADRTGAPKVVVVSQAAARQFWPGEDPIGKPVAVGQGGFGDRAEVIGVVGDVRYGQAHQAPRPDVYLPHLQSPRPVLILSARIEGDPAAAIAAIRREAKAANSRLPLFDIRWMRDRIADATSRARFQTALLGTFAGIALLLAAGGIYAVMSYAVAQRTREFGIRVALGARTRDVLAAVLARGLALAALGIALGTAGALAATRLLASLLHEIAPTDPPAYLAAGAAVCAVALLAAYIPARRATRVDAMEALRAE